MAEPVTPGSPVWWLTRLEKKLDERQSKIKLHDDYYEGNHPLAFAGEKFRTAFGRLFEAFADNWCLPTGSKVVTPGGLVDIDELAVGDLVAGHDGTHHEVLRTMRRAVDEDIVTFRTFGAPTARLTADHPVLATRQQRLVPITSKYATERHFRSYGIRPNTSYEITSIVREWVPAGELLPGDLVWSGVRPSTTGAMDSDWAALLGWYVAEGSVSDNGRVAFTFHRDECSYHDEVELLLKKLGQGHVTRVADARSQTVQVVTYGKKLASELERMGGRGCKNKRLAPEIMAASGLKPLIAAAWSGDGTTPRDGLLQLSYTTVSPALAEQMQTLLLRLGMVPARATIKERPGHAEAHRLTLSGIHAQSMTALLLGTRRRGMYQKAPSGVLVDGWVGYAISEVGRERYAGDVHNIETADVHSYCLPGAIAVHNCDLVVDAVEERLNVEGFRFGSQAADKEAWRMWQANQLDGDSQMAHTESLVCCESSIIVGPGDDPKTPSITVEHPSQVIIEQAEGQRRTRKAALKVWTDEYGLKMATLYMPDFIWKWKERKSRRVGAIVIANADIETTKWEPRESATEPWPLENKLGVVPVVTLANRPRLLKPGISELHRVIPIQDGVNKLVADMLVASEYQAFRQRWLSGHEVPTDPETGQPIEEFRHAIDRMFIAEDADAKFGEFSTTDLSNFVVGIEMLVQHIASQTRTPPHYFALKGQFPSGDAIKSAETGLVAKTRRKMRHFGEAWEEVMRLAFLVQGDKARYAKTGVVTVWADPESRSEAQHVDATLKKKAFDIPNEILWEDLGYTPPEIERIKQIRAADTAAGVQPELLSAPTVKRAPITVEP